MLSDRYLSVYVCLSVCIVGALWPNGWMDQDKTWQAGTPRPCPQCLRCGPSSPSVKGAQPPIFGPCILWLNGWINQDATYYRGEPQLRRHCVRWGPSSPSLRVAAPNICWGQTAGWNKMPLGMEVGLGPGDFVFDGDPADPKKRHSSTQFLVGPCPLWPNGWMDQDATWYRGTSWPRRCCVR